LEYKVTMESVYEQQKTINEYLTCSYGDHLPVPLPLCRPPPLVASDFDFLSDLSIPFQKRIADLCLHFQKNLKTKGSRALDLGCGVGRSTFELRRGYDEVLGIEYSKAFVEICCYLQRNSTLAYQVPMEGALTIPATATISPHNSTIHFSHGDASNLPNELANFDLLLAANLIDRLNDPFSFLRRLPSLVSSGGLLVITSPYTWMESFTPQERWIGGKVVNGEEKSTLDELKAFLEDSFSLLQVVDIPMTIREHSRKYQLCIPQASIWIRKESS